MQRERSQQIARVGKRCSDLRSERGLLYVVAVPLGHPDDITLRALRLLRQVDLIVAEDPAATQRLLAHHGIRVTVTSYGPLNIKEKIAVLIHRLKHEARVAIVSDCGSPVISDPGHLLVRSAHSHGLPVLSVPGPSALTAAVSVAGLSGDSFFFAGRLPETKPAMKRYLAGLLNRRVQTVAFCTSKSLAIALETLLHIAPRRTLVLACDLTKPREAIVRGTARQVQQIMLNLKPAAQDVTLIIAGRTRSGGRKPRPR